jgi:V/A-type H+-transporting ATPase subunit A
MIFKNAFLQQSAYDEVDMFTTPEKQVKMLKIILTFYEKSAEAIKSGTSLEDIKRSSLRSDILRMKLAIKNEETSKLEDLCRAVESFSLER